MRPLASERTQTRIFSDLPMSFPGAFVTVIDSLCDTISSRAFFCKDSSRDEPVFLQADGSDTRLVKDGCRSSEAFFCSVKQSLGKWKHSRLTHL